MTITESRLKSGTLTLGDDDTSDTFACQATNVRVTPSYDDDGDAVETLCGDSIPAGQRESWVLAGTSIQDFDSPAGFLAFCYEHAMETVEFSWQANAKAPTWSGRCVVVALEEGGDVNSRLTSDWEFRVAGRPTRSAATIPGGFTATAAPAEAGPAVPLTAPAAPAAPIAPDETAAPAEPTPPAEPVTPDEPAAPDETAAPTAPADLSQETEPGTGG